jgi:hypothetical protein
MNRGAGFSAEDLAGVNDHQPVAVDHVALLVDRANAVGVAIEGDAQVGALFPHGGDQRVQVFDHGRVGMVIRKAAVHLEEQFGGLAIEPLEQAMHHRTARAVAGVDDHPNAPREMELRGDLIHVGLRDIRAFDAARTA